jgi:uncharacterized membrane protein
MRGITPLVMPSLCRSQSWFWRYDHGCSAIVPTGIALSGIVVLGLAFSGWKGGEMVYRHRVGVAD